MAENKFIELEKKKQNLSEEIEKLKTENGIEESIRQKFPVAKDGEGVIVIIEDKNEVKVVEKEKKGFFSFFRNWFK